MNHSAMNRGHFSLAKRGPAKDSSHGMISTTVDHAAATSIQAVGAR
jgi:hypothetical protein